MGETNYGRSGCLSVDWEFSKNQYRKTISEKQYSEKTIFRIDLK